MIDPSIIKVEIMIIRIIETIIRVNIEKDHHPMKIKKIINKLNMTIYLVKNQFNKMNRIIKPMKKSKKISLK